LLGPPGTGTTLVLQLERDEFVSQQGGLLKGRILLRLLKDTATYGLFLRWWGCEGGLEFSKMDGKTHIATHYYFDLRKTIKGSNVWEKRHNNVETIPAGVYNIPFAISWPKFGQVGEQLQVERMAFGW
jgi:hypothetical protein